LLVVAKWYLGRQEIPAPERSILMARPVSAVAQANSDPASAVASAPAVAMLVASSMPGASQPVDSLRGKSLIEVKSEEEPVAAPEAKKVARSKPERVRVDVSESESSAEANPELLKKISPQQRAENEFRKANLAVQEGRTNDALAGYESALLADPTFKPARRAWVGVLVGLKRNDEAEQVLQRGLKRDSHDASFAMLLARLQVERDAVPLALETLQKTLPYAEGQADYQSFVAALFQRLSRHDEAVAHYQIALKLVPNNGVWWMGLGMSLQAQQRKDEAREAYQHALATNALNPQLQAFVQQKLKEL
jgi:MSHA biogenesis protein MshN